MDTSFNSGSKCKPASKQPRLIACRECHRSKLRCDREYPCKSCIKRGCADICPNGILVKSKRPKASALDSVKLQETNDNLNERVRHLEEALAASHAQLSTDPHPLLTDRLFLSDPQAKHYPQELGSVQSSNLDGWDEEAGSVSSYGTLTFGVDGKTTFHGNSASPDILLESETKDTVSDFPATSPFVSSLPPEIIELANMFPFGTQSQAPSHQHTKSLILEYLPQADKAWHLCEAWYENGAWLNDPVPRSEFVSHVFDPIYKFSSVDEISSDILAVFFIVLALGSLLDLQQPFDHLATDPLLQLSLAAFCLKPVYGTASIPSIQALHLILEYLYMTNRQGLEYRWLSAGLLARLLESSGLLRNSQPWTRNDPAETQRRCKAFWESYAWDVWQSFNCGRSPALSSPHIQCQLPLEVDQPLSGSTSAYNAWKYQYRFRCLAPIMEEAFGAKTASHAVILRLDRKIRDFEVPTKLCIPSLSPPFSQENDQAPLHLTLQRHAVLCERELTLLHLHRSFMSQALHESPGNPLGNKHAASVFATYRSASLIVSATQDLSLKHSELTSRIWTIWSAVFSAATVLGNIVIRSPNCQLSSSALIELGVAADMLETRTVRSRAEGVIPVVRRLRDKAHEIYKQHTNKVEAPRRSPPGVTKDDELSIFSGHTRLISMDKATTSEGSQTRSIASSPSLSPPPELSTPETVPSLHPDVFATEGPGVPGYMSFVDSVLATAVQVAPAPPPCDPPGSNFSPWMRFEASQNWHLALGVGTPPSQSGTEFESIPGMASLPFRGLPGSLPPGGHSTWHHTGHRPSPSDCREIMISARTLR